MESAVKWNELFGGERRRRKWTRLDAVFIAHDGEVYEAQLQLGEKSDMEVYRLQVHMPNSMGVIDLTKDEIEELIEMLKKCG